jgi:sarcosine oxidase subunit alpha
VPNPIIGHVTSWCFSPHVDASIALALLSAGRSRHGETLSVVAPLANEQAHVTVGPPVFVDADGSRLRG